jgi:2-dehydropantoate 2-reductase
MAASGRRYPLAIIGPGALGLAFASRLAKHFPTALIARTDARARALREGVRVGRGIFRPDAFGPGALPRADWVIVLVKAFDTAPALRLAARMQPKAVLSLQNGLMEGVAQGVTTAAAYRDGHRVVPVAAGQTLLPPGFAPLARRLRRAGFAARVSRDIDVARYRKLLANVCINPVTALYGVRNGALRRPPYDALVARLAREAAAVLAAEGVRIASGEAVERVMQVAAATARNRSSMLQDVLAGRRTEIEQLTGALLRLARRRRIPVPTHRAVYRLVRNFRAPNGSIRRTSRIERIATRRALESRRLSELLHL